LADHTLTELSAVEAVAALTRGEVRPTELVEAAAARIGAVDPVVNALPTLCIDRALAHAARIEAEQALPWLAGLPLAIKDLTEVAGVRTTFGSPIFAEHVPARSDTMVERIEGRGGIVIAKSNTPEFGAGAQTFNEVFGRTLNPWDTSKTCGGSSGGAAVALATGMAWLAQGSDLGGSLRTPAGFCGVVGLRPSIGLVPHGPSPLPFNTLSVEGPMGRTVADVALFLDAMTASPPGAFDYLEAVNNAEIGTAFARRRVGYSADLGIVPVDPAVTRVTDAAAGGLEKLGLAVTTDCPDFSTAREVFQVLRAVGFAAAHGEKLTTHRDLLKPDVVWNIEAGLTLTGERVAWAERERGRIHNAMMAYFAEHDFLLAPTAIVPPFDVGTTSISEVNGHRFETYIDWIAITFAITLTGCPTISIPCGFTENGLPIGLQVVAPPHREARLLAAARLMEEVFGVALARPIDPRVRPSVQ